LAKSSPCFAVSPFVLNKEAAASAFAAQACWLMYLSTWSNTLESTFLSFNNDIALSIFPISALVSFESKSSILTMIAASSSSKSAATALKGT
jgi:hypothetical protein